MSRREPASGPASRLIAVGNRRLLYLLAAGVAVRLGLVFLWGSPTGPEVLEYDEISRNLLAGLGYSYTHLGATYRSFYSGVPYVALTVTAYALFPPGRTAMLVLQALVAAGLATVVFLIARWVWDERAGLVASLITVTHPAIVYFDARKLHPLSFDALAIALAVASLLALRRLPAPGIAALAGLLLGVAILQRGSVTLLLPAGLLWLAVVGPGLKRVVALGAVYLLAGLLVVGPWIARNYAIHGRWLLESTFAQQFWKGNATHSEGSGYLASGRSVFEEAPARFVARLHSLDEAGQSDLFWQAARDQVVEHPARFAWKVAAKVRYFWTFAPQSGVLYPRAYFYLYVAYYAVFMSFALVGVVRLLRNQEPERGGRADTWLLITVCLAVSLVHSVFFVEMRHRWAIEPLLAVPAAAGLVTVFARRPAAGSATHAGVLQP